MTSNKPAQLSLVPNNPREETRKRLGLPQEAQIKDLLQDENWLSLVEEFEQELGDQKLPDLAIESAVHSGCKKHDLRDFYIDYVDQRERLKRPSYRSAIIEMALTFDVTQADIPNASRVKDEEPYKCYLSDWQKRKFSILLRKQYMY